MRQVIALGLAGALLSGCSLFDTSSATRERQVPASVNSEYTPTRVKVVPVGTSGMKSLQRALSDRGYYKGKIDGVNGPATRSAVARYQQNLGVVPVTGEVDGQTWTSLGLSEGN